jgi:hypothetical protein
MTLRIKQRLNRLRYLSIRKRLTARTSSNVYAMSLSTSPFADEVGLGERTLHALTIFTDTWEPSLRELRHKSVVVGVVVLNRLFQIALSRTSRD